jgi:glycosyltransferase involved in cell wall biosynthesis
VTGRTPVTIVVPVRNEAARIPAFLRAHRWADQIIVVDNGSTDGSAAAARAHGALVLERPEATLPELRNAGTEQAAHRWVLALDADESATEELATEVAAVVRREDGPRAYRVRRRNFYLGREQRRGRWARDWIVRLFHRELRYRPGRVHEQLEPVEPIGTLDGTLLHEPYRDLSHHLDKMNRYARWGALDLRERGRHAGVAELTVRPLWRFVESYLVHGSVLDGRFGLITSALGAYAGFLKWAHLWALEQEGDRPGQAAPVGRETTG